MNGLTMRLRQKSKDTLRQMKIIQCTKTCGTQESNSKSKIYSNIGLPQETRKISTKQSKLLYLNEQEKDEKAQSD